MRRLLVVAAVAAAAAAAGTSHAHAATCVKVGKTRACLVEGKACPPQKFAKAWTARGFVCADGLLRVAAKVEATIPVPGGPTQIEYLGGAVWVVAGDSGAVVRIDPATNAVVATIPTGVGGGYLASGDGSIWAASSGTDSVYRIDPATNTVVAVIPTGSFAFGVATTPGAVWVSNHRHLPTEKPTVVRIDTATNRVVATIPVGVASSDGTGGPGQLVVAGGAVWTNLPNANAVFRIDIADNSVKSFTNGGCDGSGVSLAGSVWMTGTCSNVISRFDPATGAVTAQVSGPVGSGNIGSLATDGSYVWATGDKKLLVEFDPATNRVVTVRYTDASRPFGGGPLVTIGGGSLWVTDYPRNRVLRVTPP
jgi:YVTN family beta-propeller protein